MQYITYILRFEKNLPNTDSYTHMFSHTEYICNGLISSLWQEVVSAVAKAAGVRHLISMATSEHVIMQNEALVSLAIASAIDIGKAILGII